MSYLKINVDDGDKEFVQQLLQQLGYEVTEEQPTKATTKKAPAISPTMLFGKWKNVDIDPVNYRKQLWAQKK